MFIASIAGMRVFSPRPGDVSVVAGISIIGIAAADGPASGVLLLAGSGDVAVRAGDAIVIPGIGVIVAWEEGWALTASGAIETIKTAKTFIIDRQSKRIGARKSIYYIV